MLKDFLKTSSTAEIVRLDGNVILNKTRLSADDLMGIRQAGELNLENDRSGEYELEVNGLTIAKGRIIKKKGEYYLKISEINKEGVL